MKNHITIKPTISEYETISDLGQNYYGHPKVSNNQRVK